MFHHTIKDQAPPGWSEVAGDAGAESWQFGPGHRKVMFFFWDDDLLLMGGLEHVLFSIYLDIFGIIIPIDQYF